VPAFVQHLHHEYTAKLGLVQENSTKSVVRLFNTLEVLAEFLYGRGRKQSIRCLYERAGFSFWNLTRLRLIPLIRPA
jgi:hypothetical protein